MSLAVFTLEEEQIVSWRQTNHLTCKLDKQIFQRANRLIFGHLERQFFPDDLSVETNKSTTVQHKFTSDGQMPDDLSVQTICSSSSVKTAILLVQEEILIATSDLLQPSKSCHSPPPAPSIPVAFPSLLFWSYLGVIVKGNNQKIKWSSIYYYQIWNLHIQKRGWNLLVLCHHA